MKKVLAGLFVVLLVVSTLTQAQVVPPPAATTVTLSGTSAVQGPTTNNTSGNPNPVVVGSIAAGGLVESTFSPTANANGADGKNMLSMFPYRFNGSLYDKSTSASLANFTVSTTLTARNSIGTTLIEKGGRWSVVSAPAASSQSSATIASEASVRHVVDCVSFSATASAAITTNSLTVVVRDGATGAGTVIWSWAVNPINIGTGAQSVTPHSICGLNLIGTTATAMTVEFSAGVTNVSEDVSVSGYNVN